jgi:hypothetical protein
MYSHKLKVTYRSDLNISLFLDECIGEYCLSHQEGIIPTTQAPISQGTFKIMNNLIYCVDNFKKDTLIFSECDINRDHFDIKSINKNTYLEKHTIFNPIEILDSTNRVIYYSIWKNGEEQYSYLFFEKVVFFYNNKERKSYIRENNEHCYDLYKNHDSFTRISPFFDDWFSYDLRK